MIFLGLGLIVAKVCVTVIVLSHQEPPWPFWGLSATTLAALGAVANGIGAKTLHEQGGNQHAPGTTPPAK